MKYIKGHYVDSKTGKSAADFPMTNGPALPSESITVDVVDRRLSPSLVVGVIPDSEEVPSSFEEITQTEHTELVKLFNDWREQYAADQLELSAAQERKRRDTLLNESDYAVLPDTPVTDIEEWKTYRQALRDIPQQPGFPNNIDWPEKPS